MSLLLQISSWYREGSVPSGAKARGFLDVYGTAEALPSQNLSTPKANSLCGNISRKLRTYLAYFLVAFPGRVFSVEGEMPRTQKNRLVQREDRGS
jgi:hypothetical protein